MMLSKTKLGLLLFFISCFVSAQENVIHISHFKLYKDATLIKEWNSGAATFPKVYLDKDDSFKYLRIEINDKRLDTISERIYSLNFSCNTPKSIDLWNRSHNNLTFKKELLFETLSKCESNDGVIIIRVENTLISLALHLDINEYTDITGILFEDEIESIGTYFDVENTGITTSTNFDGKFSLKVPRESIFNLVIRENEILGYDQKYRGSTVIIKNINSSSFDKIDFGKIVLPKHQIISPKKYEKLSLTERGYCVPIYHYAELLGYKNWNNFEENYILFTCGNIEKKVKFKNDSVNRRIIINWEEIQNCF